MDEIQTEIFDIGYKANIKMINNLFLQEHMVKYYKKWKTMIQKRWFLANIDHAISNKTQESLVNPYSNDKNSYPILSSDINFYY